MTTCPERQKIIMWINQVTDTGATKSKACHTLGISIRTIQRWVDANGGVIADRRPCAVRKTPANNGGLHYHRSLEKNSSVFELIDLIKKNI